MNKIEKILNELHPEYEYGDSENFIEDGLLDSFDIVTLVTSLEEVFNIQIDGLDVIPDNFMTINTIEELVKKSGGKA